MATIVKSAINKDDMKSRKGYIGIFIVVTFFYWSALFSHVSILSGHAEDIGSTTAFIGIISGSYGVSQVLLRIPLGFLSDKWNNRKIFIIGALVAILAAGLMMMFTDVPSGLLIGRLLCGIAGCAFVQITVLFTSYFPNDRTTSAVGLIVAISNLSQMAGMLMGGFVANAYGKVYAFLLTSILAGIGLVISLFIIDKPVKSTLKLSDFRRVITRRDLIVASFLGVICLILAYGKSFTFVPLVANRIGATSLEQSIVTAIFSLLSIIAALASSRLKASARNLIILGFLFHAIGSFLIPIKTTMPILYLSQTFSGIGNGLLFSLLMSMSIHGIKDNLRGSGMGIFQAVYGLGMIFGPVIFGLIAQKYSLNIGFASSGIIALMGAVLAYIMIKNGKFHNQINYESEQKA